MNQIKIILDGKEMLGNAGETVLKIAADHGVEIPNLCFNKDMKIYGACGLCVVEAENTPKLLRACATVATDGMVIHTRTPRVERARKIAMELLMSDHEGDCKGPCSLHCPAGTDVQGYVKEIARGNYAKAVEIIKNHVPLPASIGRVCPHPCEEGCRRTLVEEALSIAYLKAFAADRDAESDNPFRPEIAELTGKKVAVIGGGPAGLTAAYYLRCMGHEVAIYDSMPKMGGMLRYGIPEYRLPKAILDREVKAIEDLGVAMKNGVRIGQDISFAEIRNTADVTLVTIGAWKSQGVGCAGEEQEGVLGGIDFLRQVSLGNAPAIGNRVAVVGGGNTAMDACRTAVRLGAKEVYVIYRRTRKEAPADDLEIEEAIEEGVIFKFLTNPAEIIGENGRVTAIKLQVMELGEPDASGRRAPVAVEGKFETIAVDTVIAAIGQKADPKGFDSIQLNRKGIIAADERNFTTSVEGVFAMGDATNHGASIAIDAIGEAGKAAKCIDAYLLGMPMDFHPPYVSERVVTKEMLAEQDKQARAKMSVKPAQERNKCFEEVINGFTEEQARAEAGRCLECGCHDYEDCKLIRYANLMPIAPARLAGDKHGNYTETRLTAIERNQGKCILCSQCVRICDEVVGKGLLGLVGRGFTTVIKPEFNDEKWVAGCRACHKCVDVCPTGTLRFIND